MLLGFITVCLFMQMKCVAFMVQLQGHPKELQDTTTDVILSYYAFWNLMKFLYINEIYYETLLVETCVQIIYLSFIGTHDFFTAPLLMKNKAKISLLAIIFQTVFKLYYPMFLFQNIVFIIGHSFVHLKNKFFCEKNLFLIKKLFSEPCMIRKRLL